MKSTSIDERRGSMCAKCEALRGNAVNVTYRDGTKIVTYVCGNCGRIWDHVDTKPSPEERP